MKEVTMEDLMNTKKDENKESGNPNLTVEEAGLPAEVQSAELTVEERKRVDEIKNAIDLTDSQTAVRYGVGAQRNIAGFSENILTNIRSKNAGEVGELMTDLLVKVKALDIESLASPDKGLLGDLFASIKRKLEKFTAKYQTVEVQIDQIEGQLDRARMSMIKDIALFDTLYDKNLEYFRELKIFIAAGEEAVKEQREKVLPKLKQEAEASDDPMEAQLVQDYEESVNRFEKKVYDLKLSKTMAIQTAPQIRLVQNNDKLLVEKIQTTIFNTIPLWKSQIVIALGMQRQKDVLELQRNITSTTNELLTRNSEMLKQNTVDVARESERGILDLETLQTVNRNLIATIDETLKIQREGREQRAKAETELLTMENELRSKLLASREA